MKKLLFVVLPVLTVLSCTQKPSDIKPEVVKKLQKLSSIHYKVLEKSYYSNEPDTTVTPYEVWAVRDDEDTLRGGYVWVDNNYRPYNMMYDRGNFYIAIPPKKTTILYKDFKEPFIGETDWIDFFLKPEVLSGILSDKKNNVVMKDTVIEGKQEVWLNIAFPKNNHGVSKTYSFILNEKTLLPLWSKLTMITKDYTYHDELTFSDTRTNSVDPGFLKQRQEKVLKENKPDVNGNGSVTARLEKMLHPGDNAPLFKARCYSDEKPFELKDFTGKNVIIVDFWYTHCHPCVKAMPSLDKLYRKYKDKGLKIFGINSVDNRPKSKKLLDNFLSKRDISYDIILATPDVDIMYKVNGYPTMYVIDKNGKIAHAELGFREKSFNEMVKKVEELLKK